MPFRARHAPPCFALSACVLIGGASAEAQLNSSALEITVQAAEDDRALVGAQVRVEGFGLQGITDRNGFARVSDLPSGTRRVQVSYLGYATLEERIAFIANEPTPIRARLELEPIALQEVDVTARQSLLVLRGFYRRQQGGQGTFYTREQIEQMRPRYLSDLLRRVGGIQLGSGLGGRSSARSRGPSSFSGPCNIQFYIDGVLTAAFSPDDVRPEDIEGLEIYNGAATIPMEFNRGDAACGVILVWTRNQ